MAVLTKPKPKPEEITIPTQTFNTLSLRLCDLQDQLNTLRQTTERQTKRIEQQEAELSEYRSLLQEQRKLIQEQQTLLEKEKSAALVDGIKEQCPKIGILDDLKRKQEREEWYRASFRKFDQQEAAVLPEGHGGPQDSAFNIDAPVPADVEDSISRSPGDELVIAEPVECSPEKAVEHVSQTMLKLEGTVCDGSAATHSQEDSKAASPDKTTSVVKKLKRAFKAATW